MRQQRKQEASGSLDPTTASDLPGGRGYLLSTARGDPQEYSGNVFLLPTLLGSSGNTTHHQQGAHSGSGYLLSASDTGSGYLTSTNNTRGNECLPSAGTTSGICSSQPDHSKEANLQANNNNSSSGFLFSTISDGSCVSLCQPRQATRL